MASAFQREAARRVFQISYAKRGKDGAGVKLESDVFEVYADEGLDELPPELLVSKQSVVGPDGVTVDAVLFAVPVQILDDDGPRTRRIGRPTSADQVLIFDDFGFVGAMTPDEFQAIYGA